MMIVNQKTKRTRLENAVEANKPERGDEKTDETANTASRMNKKALPGDSFNSFKAFMRKSSIGSK